MKKAFALLLSVLMVISVLPVAVVSVKASETNNCSYLERYRIGNIIEFGSYPQSEVLDETLISELNEQELNWQSYGYYTNTTNNSYETMFQSNYMQYADVIYAGQKYRAVTFTLYRPGKSTQVATEDPTISYQDDAGYSLNTVYWFKFEPLKWKILDPKVGFVLCDSIIDSQAINCMLKDSKTTINGRAANLYNGSSLQTWLTTTFYNTAFSQDDISVLNTYTATDISSCKIFLPSVEELANKYYGFNNIQNSQLWNYPDGETRRKETTDYAKIQGVNVGTWWTRSKDYSNYGKMYWVKFSGEMVQLDTDPNYTCIGVVPAIVVNLSILQNCKHQSASIVNQVDATCENDGYSGDLVCDNCGEILEYGTIIPALNHNWGEWTDKGDGANHERECARCHITETAVHVWNEGVQTKAPTCKEQGSTLFTCTVCGATKTEPIAIDSTNHADYGTHVENAASATCTEAGYTGDTVCNGCGAVLMPGETINPLDHNWGEWTDKGDGANHERECDRCHETETAVHVWNEGVQTKAPTCNEEGSTLFTCTVCGATKTEAIAIDPNNHSGYGMHIENAAPATCTEAGYTGDAVCNGCGAVLTIGVTIDAHGHDYHKNEAKSLAPDYGVDGYDYYECSFDASHFYKVNVPALVKNTYTVTFTADGEVVAVVPYTEDDKFVNEPAIPEKDNCTAEWAEYTLNNTDITVEAIYTPIDLNDISDIETEKTIDSFENGVASITLSASAATRAVRFTTSTKKPVDVIMVLDLSGSMDETLGAGVSETKMEALKACAIGFIEKVNRAGSDNRIALVGFASGNQRYNTSQWENTGLIVTGATGFVSYPNAASYYNKALMPTGNITGVDGRIIDAINGLEANGATCTHIGLLMAKNILAQNGADGREKVVVLITDGNPTIGGTVKNEINQAAPIAVTYANDIKNMGVKLYTVGVDAAANENAAFTSAPDGVTVNGNTTAFDFNRFLNIVSTNYPDAVAMNNYGAKQNSGYYMGVNDTSKLDEIFSKIIYSSVDRPVAFTKCNLVDTLSADFTFTLEQEYAFRDALARAYNIPDANISVTRNADGTTTIRVNGVPAVKTEKNGKTASTASVTCEASLNQYAAGAYVTNTDNAFVEIDGEPIAFFAVPQPVTVSADRNIVVFKINGEIYRIDEGSLGDEVTAPVTALAGWTIPEGSVITGNYAEFEATDIVTDMYTVTWDVDGEQTTETYAFGSQINIPAVADKEDLVFAGFSPAVPHIMPARNMTFTAVFAPKHNHAFKEIGYYGTCTDGLVIVSKCACGKTVESRQAATAHRFATVVGSCVGNTLTDTLVCSVCGASEQHTMSFQTVTTSRGRTTVLDLSLEKNGTVIQPVSGSTIKIMIPWTNQGYTNTNVKVTRVNEQGVQKTYNATIENGYLVFYADHFSIYLVEELDAQGNEMEPVSYQCAICELNGTHRYETVVTAATCTANGYTTHTCPVCGDSYVDAQTNKTGHKWSVWTPTKAPSCTEEGQEMRVCANDSKHVETRPLAKMEHRDVNGDGYCDFGCGAYLGTPEPNKPQSNCACGQYHSGPFAGIIIFFHRIAYFFKNLFK